jgi:cytochrome b involved in lipid metabolism
MAPRSASAANRSPSPLGKANSTKHSEKTVLVSPEEVERKRLLVINGKCYDAPSFLADHPGGDIMMTYAGRDATDVFSGSF